MLTCMAGAGFTRNVGDIVEVPEDEAGRLVAAGFAVDASTAPEATIATDKKPEEPPKRRVRPPANRDTAPAPAPDTPPAPVAPAVETPPESVPPVVTVPASEPPAAPA